MTDTFSKHAPTLDGPASSAQAITPSDTTDLPTVPRSLYIGGDGDVTVMMQDGQTVTFAGLMAGGMLPIRASRVMATGTTASNLVAVW